LDKAIEEKDAENRALRERAEKAEKRFAFVDQLQQENMGQLNVALKELATTRAALEREIGRCETHTRAKSDASEYCATFVLRLREVLAAHPKGSAEPVEGVPK